MGRKKKRPAKGKVVRALPADVQVLKEKAGSRGLICSHWLQVGSTTQVFFPFTSTYRLATLRLFPVDSRLRSKKPHWWVLPLNQNQVNLSQGGFKRQHALPRMHSRCQRVKRFVRSWL